MSEAESIECRHLGRALADTEWKLTFWKKQLDTACQIVDHLTEKQASLMSRQKEILEGKAKAAGA